MTNASKCSSTWVPNVSASPSLLLSRRDLDFLLYEWLDVDELTRHERYRAHSRATFNAVLDVSQQIAEQDFATHNKLSDQHEAELDGDQVYLIPEIETAVQHFAEAGLISCTLDDEYGGVQLPHVLATACRAWFQAANISTYNYLLLTIAAIDLMLKNGTTAQIDSFARPMAEGRFFGTMCISEPQVGSSLADMATRAEPQGDGSYRIFGSKVWVSAGDHSLGENIVHLVLARVPGSPPGTKGLSLFIVPKFLVTPIGEVGERNDVAVVGLNRKMGCRGTTNTVLGFGEGKFSPGNADGAVGYLLGKQNEGLTPMFHMMNHARIGVGIGAAALGYTGYLKAVTYARQRKQGHALDQSDGSETVAIIEHPDVKRMLLAQKAYVEGGLALGLYCSRLVDEMITSATLAGAQAAELLLDLLTPIAKSWPAQWCLAANDLAIQVHGGYGYTRDYDVEQHYRDNRLNAIHEGTHGIQALDLIRRKVLDTDGAAFDLLLNRVRDTIDIALTQGGESARMAAQLRSVLERFAELTLTFRATRQRALVVAHASTYMEAAGHLVVAWIWLSQVLRTRSTGSDFYSGKRAAAAFFYAYELPKARVQLELLSSLDRTVAEVRPTWF